MNHVLQPDTLRNRYYGMRHGQSLANVQQLIISKPEHGLLKDYALSAYGRQQVQDAAERCTLTAATCIYTSDFSRARETAAIVQHIIGTNEVLVTPALRERSFGVWEKTHHSNYEKVWQGDTAGTLDEDVESVYDIVERTVQLIQEIEAAHQDQDILLVSHGDTLQILRTVFERQDPSKHRSQTPWETAEIKRL